MYPRRKVVSAKQLHGMPWQNTWVCQLECGHSQHSIGRMRPVGIIRQHVPPATAGCRKCDQQAKPEVMP